MSSPIESALRLISEQRRTFIQIAFVTHSPTVKISESVTGNCIGEGDSLAGALRAALVVVHREVEVAANEHESQRRSALLTLQEVQALIAEVHS